MGLIIVGVSKGGFGGGLGVVGVPFLAATIPVNQAAAIMLPCLIIMDLAGIYGWRGQWCWEQLKRLLPAAGVGVCFGALSFHLLSDNALRIMIGHKVGLGFWNTMVGSAPGIHAISRAGGAWSLAYCCWSMIAGFTSFSVHAGGPPLQISCCLKTLIPRCMRLLQWFSLLSLIWSKYSHTTG